jgi:hypothetical protein
MERMRGPDGFTESMFTVLKLDDFVPKDHPLRPIRSWLNDALKRMDDVFARMYEADAKGGRPSIAPEKVARTRRTGVALQRDSRDRARARISFW